MSEPRSPFEEKLRHLTPEEEERWNTFLDILLRADLKAIARHLNHTGQRPHGEDALDSH